MARVSWPGTRRGRNNDGMRSNPARRPVLPLITVGRHPQYSGRLFLYWMKFPAVSVSNCDLDCSSVANLACYIKQQRSIDGNPPTSADIVWRDPKAAAINAGHSTDYARDMHHQFGDLYWCDLEPEVWWYVAGKIGNTATVKITVRDTDCWEFHPVQKEPT